MKKIIQFFKNLNECIQDIRRTCQHVHYLLADIRNKINEVEIKND